MSAELLKDKYCLGSQVQLDIVQKQYELNNPCFYANTCYKSYSYVIIKFEKKINNFQQLTQDS